VTGVRLTVEHLVGRDDELETIVRLFDAPERLPSAAVVAGEAGIGKTTIWQSGIDAAAGLAYRILAARPSEAETRSSFMGLTDLLGPVAGDVLSELPPVQQRALEAALLLGDSQTSADDRTVAAAFRTALRHLATDAPVCLAVDDLQWLDAASLAALRFVLSRLDDEPIVVLLAVRGSVPAWIRRAVPEDRLRTVEVGGLSLGALNEVLRARLGATFPRPTLIRLWETSSGNPFFALELGGALQRKGATLAPGEELPIPSDLDELLRARFDGVGAAALEVARAVAALAEPTVPLVESAVGRRSKAGLAEMLDARILELDGERLRFTHPLLGSAVATGLTPSQRRSLHARLAELVPAAEERARHLALATGEPNRERATILEEAARSADSRGGPAAAAELAEQALRLTPAADVEEARRRLLLAADRHDVAGDHGRALALLERARAEAAPGVGRAAVLLALADVLFYPDIREAERLYEEALSEAAGDDALEAEIHLRLANTMGWGAGIERGFAHAALAVEAASRTDDLALRCCALAADAHWQFRAGRGLHRAAMDKALALERELPGWPLEDGPAEKTCYLSVCSVDLDRARTVLLELRDVCRAKNDANGEAWPLWWLALLELRAGNWDEAGRYASDSLDLKTQLGSVSHHDEFPGAAIAAHQGRVADARTRAHRSIARGEAAGVVMEQADHCWVLGFLELSLGDANAALGHLRRSYELRNAIMLEPALRPELGDLLEALIAAGELDEAEEVLATWQERAAAVDRAWALAILARGRALLLAARKDLDGAFACFERALAEHARSPDPFHHARTLLALGRTQRRAKRRGAARTTLEQALAGFEGLGAPLWAEQARTELARIGGRAPTRGELTEAERRIAALVAQGRTNREVAAALFLTEHSVETALTRVYRKLGVRSRTELAHLLSAKT
jgi:DNA-binding CsgD family transcriptional regulator